MSGSRAAARAAAILLAAATFGPSLAAAAGAFPYRVLHRISLEGAGAAPAVAFGPAGKHFYAAVGQELRSYDAVSAQPGAGMKLPGAAVAIAASTRDDGVLYVATRAPARLLILAVNPLRIRSSIGLRGGAPSALLYDDVADALYLESAAGRAVTRLDPKTGRPLGTVRLTGRLTQMAGNGRGTLYVADAAGDDLEVIAGAAMKRLGAIPLSRCTAPTGLAMDPVGRRLFVACGNGVALVVDEEMGFAFERLPIERASDLRLVFALHPLGAGGWKGGVFMAGDGPALDAIQMKAFISYVGGGSLPLDGRCTALAVSAAARRLVVALAPRAGVASGQDAAPQLLLLGANEGVSQ